MVLTCTGPENAPAQNCVDLWAAACQLNWDWKDVPPNSIPATQSSRDTHSEDMPNRLSFGFTFALIPVSFMLADAQKDSNTLCAALYLELIKFFRGEKKQKYKKEWLRARSASHIHALYAQFVSSF